MNIPSSNKSSLKLRHFPQIHTDTYTHTDTNVCVIIVNNLNGC